jgi:2-aminoadipate transaminase
MDAPSTRAGLAPRAIALPASPIRALLNARSGEGTLDLGGGHPEPRLFPAEALSQAAARLFHDERAIALQYGSTEGLHPLRAWIADRLRRRGFDVLTEQILITQGSQHALSTVTQVLGSPNQLALLEQPGYPGALQALALAECNVDALPVNDEGWDLTVLAHSTPNLVYVIPHYQNPTGRCATHSQKQALAACASQQGFFVVEDDVYGELGFDGNNHRPLIADCPERGILLGSFSKTLCPGLRLGYIAAPLELLPPLVKTLQATALQPGTFAQHLAMELLTHFDYDAHLQRLRQFYQQRAQALSSRCRELGLSLTSPEGGLFLWVTTPAAASVTAQHAAEQGLLSVPESAFRAPGLHGPDRHLRLAFSRYKDNAESRRKLSHALDARNVL